MLKRREIITKLAGLLGIGAASGLSLPPAHAARPVANPDIERLQVQLAGCSVAASGATNPEQIAAKGDYGWSPTYQDVLDLRRKFDTAVSMVSVWASRGQIIHLYPCGCVNLYHPSGGSFVPAFHCQTHGSPEIDSQCQIITGHGGIL